MTLKHGPDAARWRPADRVFGDAGNAGAAGQERPAAARLAGHDRTGRHLGCRWSWPRLTAVLLVLGTVPLAAWLVLGRARWRARRPRHWRWCRWCCRRPCWATTCWCCWGREPALAGRVRGCWDIRWRFRSRDCWWGPLIYSLPFALQPLVAGFAQVPAELLEAAALLGRRAAAGAVGGGAAPVAARGAGRARCWRLRIPWASSGWC